MAAELTTNVTELPESRVRVEAEVPPAEVERRVQQAARAMGRSLRLPGFRQGKVPPPVVIKRVGREAVLDEAVRDSLGGWYADALQAAGVEPVGDPELDLGDLPPAGEPLTFTIEIGVRPTAELGEYKGVEVGRREPEPSEEEIAAELDRLRERSATLESVERPAGEGDFVVMDYEGSIDGEPFDTGEGRDQMIELGTGRLIPGFEEQLLGASAGEERTLEVSFPGDYGTEALQSRDAEFAVTVKEVKHKRLPELDDDFAVDAAGFDSLEELRDDIREKLREGDERRVEAEFREAVLDAVVAGATVDVPPALVHAKAHDLWHEMTHSLAHQGISKEAYLRIAGKDEHDLITEAEPDAERALKREAVIAAVIEAEDIEPTEEELLEAAAPAAEREGMKPEKILGRLRDRGRLDALAREVAARRAVELLAEAATPISVEQAKARDKLWTPEKESAEAGGGQLWTPGD